MALFLDWWETLHAIVPVHFLSRFNKRIQSITREDILFGRGRDDITENLFPYLYESKYQIKTQSGGGTPIDGSKHMLGGLPGPGGYSLSNNWT